MVGGSTFGMIRTLIGRLLMTKEVVYRRCWDMDDSVVSDSNIVDEIHISLLDFSFSRYQQRFCEISHDFSFSHYQLDLDLGQHCYSSSSNSSNSFSLSK